MIDRSRLLYVEHCLPGTPRERVEHARRTGWGLEIAEGRDADWARVRRASIRVPVVQAWGLHDAGALSASEASRRRAREVVGAALERGATVGAEVCVCVCGFGDSDLEDPVGRCAEFFRALAPRAAAAGMRLGIEPLSTARASQMRPDEIDELLARLGHPDVFGTVVDTGHLLDDGLDPAAFLRGWPHRIDVLQLKERGSRAPRPDTPVASWLEALRSRRDSRVPWVSVEHREVLDAPEVERVRVRVEAAL